MPGTVSYHVYPYYPDYLNQPQPRGDGPHAHLGRQGCHLSCGDWSRTPISELLRQEDFYDGAGAVNTYLAYLRALRRHHTMPVVISEFGVSTGRGMAQRDQNTAAIRAT